MAIMPYTLESQIFIITVLVPGDIKLGKEVFLEEGMVTDFRRLTYLKQTSFDVFPGFGSQHKSVTGQDLCVAIGNLPPF